MRAPRSFRLGYSIIGWGGTPDLDEALGAIKEAGWEGAEFTGVSLEWLGTPKYLKSVFDRYELPLACIFGGLRLEDVVCEGQLRLETHTTLVRCAVQGVRFGPEAGGAALNVASLDAAVVSPINAASHATPFLKDMDPLDGALTGMGYNLWNNIWNVNYPLYYPYEPAGDENLLFRFVIDATA